MASVGVKVQLEGAAEYRQKMSEMTSQTKLFEAQMKNLQSQVGKSTFAKSIQESKILSQELQTLREKSATLEQRIRETAAAYGEDSNEVRKLQTQYENLQAQINQVDAELKEHGGLLGAVGSQLQETGSKISAVGEKISGLGDSLTTHVTAPIVALGGLSIKAFNEVDGAMDTLIKKTGATGESLEGMEQIVKDIATNMPTSFDAAANAVGEVNTRFDVTGDKLEELSTSFIKFAELNGTDVSNSIDKVQSALAAYGFTAEDAAGYLDVLNAAGQETGTSVDKLAEDVATNAASMKEMGYSLTHASFLLANLSKNGVDSSSAMNGLKKAYANSLKTGESMSDTLLDLQNRLRNSETASDAAAEAIELFGTKSGGALVEAIQSGRMAFDDFSIAMGDYMGSVDSTFENTLDPIDELQTHMNELKLIGADLANSAMPMINQALELLGENIKRISDLWNGLDDTEKETVIKIAAIAAALGPVLAIGGRLISGIGSIVSMAGTLSSFLGSIGVSLGAALGPILLVVAGIGALVAAFVALYNTNDEFKAKVDATWNEIRVLISGIIMEIQDLVGEFMVALHAFWEEHGATITQVLQAAFVVISNIVTTYLTYVKDFIKVVTAIIHGDWQVAWEAIKNLFQNLWEGIKGIVVSYLEYVKAFITMGLELLWSVIGEKVERIKLFITQALAAIKNTVSTVFNNIESLVLNTLTNIYSTVMSKINAVINFVRNAANTVKSTISDMVNGITSTITGLLTKAWNWGSDFINGFKDGIKSGVQNVLNEVKNMAQGVKDMIHFSEPDKGPLKDFNSWPRDMMQQYAEGIENGRYLVQKAVSDVTADVAMMQPNTLSADEIYSAVNAGASNANITLVIGDREFGRQLRDMGVVMA